MTPGEIKSAIQKWIAYGDNHGEYPMDMQLVIDEDYYNLSYNSSTFAYTLSRSNRHSNGTDKPVLIVETDEEAEVDIDLTDVTNVKEIIKRGTSDELQLLDGDEVICSFRFSY